MVQTVYPVVMVVEMVGAVAMVMGILVGQVESPVGVVVEVVERMQRETVVV
jgi:hypothetical protein